MKATIRSVGFSVERGSKTGQERPTLAGGIGRRRKAGTDDMLKLIAALGMAGAASLALARPSQLPGCPSDPQHRQPAVLFARTVNSREATFKAAHQRYGQISELDAGAEPGGFRSQLSTDGTTYVLVVRDATDSCHFALFSDQEGLIYAAEPMR